jgi:hypothetical protein
VWRGRWCADTWRAYLDAGVTDSELAAIRHSTDSGRTLGAAPTALPRQASRQGGAGGNIIWIHNPALPGWADVWLPALPGL